MNCVNEACVTTAAELEELKVCLARKQVSICSYCGHVAHREGRPEQEFQEELFAHILNCEKRPEHNLTRALCAVVIPLGVDIEALPVGDIPALVAAVERRWNEEIEMRQKQIDALLDALGRVDGMLNSLAPVA